MIMNAQNSKYKKISSLFFVFIVALSFCLPRIVFAQSNSGEKKFLIDENSKSYVNHTIWETIPGGGDTIFISSYNSC